MKKVLKSVSLSLLVILLSGLFLPLQVKAENESKFLAPIEPPIAGSTPISSRADLEAIKNNLSGNYHLTTDIDLSGLEWIPIGGESHDTNDSFSGIFDGQGYVIKNMRITGEYEYAGLFDEIYEGIVKSLGLENSNVNIDYLYNVGVGSICGRLLTDNKSSGIFNCYNTGAISSSFYDYGDVGGLCGNITKSPSFTNERYNDVISNCFNSGTVSVYTKNLL